MKPNKSRSNASFLEHGSKFLDSKGCKTVETAAPDLLRSEVYLKNKLGVSKKEYIAAKEKHGLAKAKHTAAIAQDTSVSSELAGIRSQQSLFAIERGLPPYARGGAAHRFYRQNPELLERKNVLASMRKETNDTAQKSASALREAKSILKEAELSLDEVGTQITNAFN